MVIETSAREEFDSEESEDDQLKEDMEEGEPQEKEVKKSTGERELDLSKINADFLPLKKLSKKGEKKGSENKVLENKGSTVIYLGRIPHGFYEKQMKGFFSQFGTVLKLRLSRNKKTGASKHYAFIEFEDSEIAKIGSETMNGYLFEDRRIICKVIPKEKIHENLWIGANKVFKPKGRYIAVAQQNREKSPKQVAKRIKKLIFKDNERKKKLKEIGYEYPGYESRVKAKASRTVLE